MLPWEDLWIFGRVCSVEPPICFSFADFRLGYSPMLLTHTLGSLYVTVIPMAVCLNQLDYSQNFIWIFCMHEFHCIISYNHFEFPFRLVAGIPLLEGWFSCCPNSNWIGSSLREYLLILCMHGVPSYLDYHRGNVWLLFHYAGANYWSRKAFPLTLSHFSQ